MQAAPRIAPRTPGLPKVWNEVLSDRGEVLYYRREHTGYEVHPMYGMFAVMLDGVQIGNPEQTLTHALVAARDHMHEHGNYPGSTTAQEANR